MSWRADTRLILSLIVRQQRAELAVHLVRAALLPLALCYLGSRVIGAAAQARGFYAGSLVVGLAFSTTALVGYSILEDRLAGRLTLLETNHLSKAGYFLSHLALATAHCLVVVTGGLAALSVLGMAQWSWGLVAGGAVVVLLAAPFLCGLAVVIGARARSFAAADSLITLSGVVLPVCSPLAYRADSLPRALAAASLGLPYTHVGNILRASLSAAPIPWVSVTVLAVMTVIVVLVAYRMAPGLGSGAEQAADQPEGAARGV